MVSSPDVLDLTNTALADADLSDGEDPWDVTVHVLDLPDTASADADLGNGKIPWDVIVHVLDLFTEDRLCHWINYKI